METNHLQKKIGKIWDVLILPMRNGNSPDIPETIFTSPVLILPMRNGNQYILF